MISVEDALELLKWHDTLAGKSRGMSTYRSLSHQQADQIAELIKHLQRGVEDGYQIHGYLLENKEAHHES